MSSLPQQCQGPVSRFCLKFVMFYVHAQCLIQVPTPELPNPSPTGYQPPEGGGSKDGMYKNELGLQGAGS